METATPQKPKKNPIYLTLTVMGTLFISVIAMWFTSIVPTEEEQRFIDYGMLKAEIAANSEYWMELETIQMGLHESNIELREQLATMESELFQ